MIDHGHVLLSWRTSACAAAQKREQFSARNRRCVLAALQKAAAALPLAAIASITNLSYHQARRALESLVAMHAVEASGPANHRRFVLFQSGMGKTTGGPASESAAAAHAGSPLSDAARPGRAA